MEGDLAMEEGIHWLDTKSAWWGSRWCLWFLYAAVFVLRGILLEFLIRDSRIVGLSISTRQRTKKRRSR